MRKILLFLAIFISISSTSQKYKPGYYVDNFGVKTSCLISDDILSDSPQESISIRKDENSPSQKVQTSTIKEIVLDNLIIYKKFIVNVDSSSNRKNDLTSDKKIDLIQREVFLEIMESGKLTLYGLLENAKYRFFYTKSDMNIPEFLDYKEYSETNIGTYILKNEFYKQELLNLMFDAGFSSEEIFKVNYEEDDMVRLFKKYNNHFGGSIKLNTEGKSSARYVKVTFKPRVSLSFVAAKSDYTKATISRLYSESDFGSKVMPEFGAEIEIDFNNKISLFTDVAYQSVKFNSNQIIYGNSSANQSYVTELNKQSICVRFGGRKYFQLKKNYDIYVNALFLLDVMVGDSYSDAKPSKTELNEAVGIGVGIGLRVFKKYFIETNYDFDRNLTSAYDYLKTNFSSFSISLMYSLN